MGLFRRIAALSLTTLFVASVQAQVPLSRASATQQSGFFTVVPCRVFDTRSEPTGLLSGVTRVFAVAGQCGVPSVAEAVSANLTVVAPTGSGFVTAFAGDAPLPLASTINFASGQIRANNAILPLAANGDGSIALFALMQGGGEVDVILDVNGYFAAETLEIRSLSPSSAPQGGTDLGLTVNGTGFQNGAVVRFDGEDLATTQTAVDQLTVTLPASKLTAAGNFPVQVVNPDGAASSAALFTVNAPLTLNALVPGGAPMGSPAFSLTLSGAGFQAGAVARFGGAPLATTYVGSGMLTATVPAAFLSQPGTALVDVKNPSGASSVPLSFKIKGLSLTGIAPSSGPVGTMVTITGDGLDLLPAVLFSKQGGGNLRATLQSSAATSLQVSVPTGAATGPVRLVSGGLTLTGPVFTVTTSRTFELTGGPPSGVIFPGESTNFGITANSSDGFAGLVALQVNGLPGGLTYKLDPRQISAGQTANLTVTAPAGQPSGLTAFTVTGTGSVEGQTLTRTLNLAVDVRPVSTSFIGRVVAAEAFEYPLVGVTVRFLGKNEQGQPNGCAVAPVRTDAGGNFAFVNLPEACTGPQLVGFDGVTDSGELYTPVNLRFDIQSGAIKHTPGLIHLTSLDDKETVLVRQSWSSDQIFTFRTIPGLKLQVYAGTLFTNPDGTTPDPFPLSALRIPIDRPPGDKTFPIGQIMPFLVSLQPEGSTSSQAVAVDYPNTVGGVPGSVVTLLTLDPRVGGMVSYGTGTISPDGLSIVADPNPATPGKRYGISHFDWHGPITPAPPDSNRAALGGESGAVLEGTCVASGGCFCPTHGSVEYATGAEAMSGVDAAITGIPLPVGFGRLYRSDLASFNGSFGLGTSHSLSYVLLAGQNSGQPAINLSIPNGRQLSFVRQPDGTYRSAGAAATRGSTLRWVAGESRYRLDTIDGSTLFFTPAFFVATSSSLSAISDRHGNQIQLVRGVGTGNVEILERIIAANGEQIELQYDTQNRINSVTDAAGRTTLYSYDPTGRLLSVTDPSGGVTGYRYDGQNHLTTVTDARGILVITKEYDSAGRVTQETYPDTGQVHYSYLTANPADSTSPVLQTQVTDPLGHTTTYRFTATGELSDVTDALGQMVSFTIDPVSGRYIRREGTAGCPVCGGSGSGNQSYEYDDQGRLTKVTDALGNSTALTYPAIGEMPSTVTDALLRTTSFTQSSVGDVISITNPAGKVTLLTYDATGRLLTLTDPNHHTTTFTYGTDGRPATVTDALNSTTTFTYDAAGRLASKQSPSGITEHLLYDPLDHITAVEDGLGQLTRFIFDAVGNLLSLTDPRSNTTTFEYNARGLPIRETAPSGGVRTFTYDLAENLVSRIDRNGHAAMFVYDALNRPVGASYNDGTLLQYEWDAAGHLLAADDRAGGRIERSLDPLGRLIKEVSPGGMLHYSHDEIGRLTTRTGPDGTTAYGYNYQGLLESVTNGTMAVHFTYDNAGHRLTATPPNAVTVNYSYDAADQLGRIDYASSTGFSDFRSYGYNPDGRIISIGGNSLSTSLPSPQTAIFDTSNYITALDGRGFSYDAEGHLLSDEDQVYRWNSLGQLVETLGADGTVDYRYDALGRRLLKIEQGIPVSYLIDGLDVVRMSTGAENVDFLRGRQLDETWAARLNSGVITYLRDIAGSTMAILGSDGSADLPNYTDYGSIDSQLGSLSFGFTGREHDGNGLIYLRSRYYSPHLGRFISEDPIGSNGNSFVYSRNNPVSFIDPLGLDGLSLTESVEDLSALVLDTFYGTEHLGDVIFGARKVDHLLRGHGLDLQFTDLVTVAGIIVAAFNPELTLPVALVSAISTDSDLFWKGLNESLSDLPRKCSTVIQRFDFPGLGFSGLKIKTTTIEGHSTTTRTIESTRIIQTGGIP